MYGLQTIKRMNAKSRQDSDNKLIRFDNPDQASLDYIKSQGGFQSASDTTLSREDRIEELFVDTSGFGRDYERALTQDQMCERLAELVETHGPIAVGIEEFGQFQAYLGVWPA